MRMGYSCSWILIKLPCTDFMKKNFVNITLDSRLMEVELHAHSLNLRTKANLMTLFGIRSHTGPDDDDDD